MHELGWFPNNEIWSSKMQHCITMSGHICSGKTSLIKKLSSLNAFKVVNTDNYLHEKVLDGTFADYPEAFKCYQSEALARFNKDFYDAANNGENIIIDRLNTNVRSRNKILDTFTNHKNICINVKTPWFVCHRRYLKTEARYKQDDQPNLYREIPEEMLISMSKSMSVPSLREGFDTIIHITAQGKLHSVQGEMSELVTNIIYELD